MALRRRRLGDARSDGRTSAQGRRHLSDGQRESHRGRALPLPPVPREDGHSDHEHPGRRGPRPFPQDGEHRPGRHRKGSSHAAGRAEAYANVLSFLRFASIRSILACSSRSMCARISDHGTLRRYECTGRPLPSFLMSRLSTHRRRRSSCIAMLTSGWRSPVAFSISTDVVSSRLDRKTRVLAIFFFQAEDGIRYYKVTGVQTCALPISQVRLRRGAVDLRGGALRLGVRRAEQDPPAPDSVLGPAYLEANGDELSVESDGGKRSEERRVGKECRSRWPPYH